MTILIVAAGGAIGSVARYLISSAVLRVTGTLFPLGTFVVNVTGCTIFGIIVGAAERRLALTPNLRTFLLVGIMGGYTTFSSYAFESFALIRDGQSIAAAINIVGQVVAGLVGLWIGYVAAN